MKNITTGFQSKYKYLIIFGLCLIIIGMLFNKKSASQSSSEQSPEDQLIEALNNRLPTMVFFHSTTCDPCMEMIENVNQAYPEFKQSITLIDVNVSDERNHSLLRSQGVQLIPSLMFFERDGQSRIVYGVITPEQIQEELITLLEQ